MPKKCTTYRLLCEMASFLKFYKGVTILLLDPVGKRILKIKIIRLYQLHRTTKEFDMIKSYQHITYADINSDFNR